MRIVLAILILLAAACASPPEAPPEDPPITAANVPAPPLTDAARVALWTHD